MICFVSAFRTRGEAATFEQDNASVLRQPDIVWSVAIGEQADNPFPEDARRNVTMQPDRCYAEGWNNALDGAAAREWWHSGLRVAFLGTGDRVLAIDAKAPDPAPGHVLLGQTHRPGAPPNGRLPARSLAFATLRAWTPAALFPAALFSGFRFPTHTRIASDVDVFFAAFEAGLGFRPIAGYAVEMDAGGLSSDIETGAREYRELYEARFGPSVLARSAERLKRMRARGAARGAAC